MSKAPEDTKKISNPLLDYIELATGHMLAIARDKNRDYAGDGDPFANFKTVDQLGITSVEQGILTRMADKFTRIINLTKPGTEAAVKDETVEDTLLDLANYSLILAAWLRHRSGRDV